MAVPLIYHGESSAALQFDPLPRMNDECAPRLISREERWCAKARRGLEICLSYFNAASAASGYDVGLRIFKVDDL